MSEGWGPGTPDNRVEPVEGPPEREEPEADPNPPEDAPSEEEPAQPSREEILAEDQRDPKETRKWHEGSVDTVLESYRGEYGFLPVFGFNEGHVAVRRFMERINLDGEDWWAVEGTEGKMFDDDNEPTRIDGKELSWWETDSIMPRHPFMLINPVGFTTADADKRDFRDLFRIQKGEHFVFSDSGGYQLMSMDNARIVDDPDEHSFQDLNVHPETLLEWQTHNADAGATIDFPPYNISGDANFPDAAQFNQDWYSFFEARREQSRDMTARMASKLGAMRTGGDAEAKDYIFAPVIHGKPKPQNDPHTLIDSWHTAMLDGALSNGIAPRGWVLKPEPSHSFGQIALHLGYAAEELVETSDYIHVLMVGGLLQKTILMYFAAQTDVLVTSDASSYAAGGKRRQFDLPKTARRRSVIITNRTDEERVDATVDATRLDRYPCRCQVCSTVERTHGFDFVTTGTGSARNATLNLHNLHQALSIEQTLDALIREEGGQLVETGGHPTGSEFWRYVKTVIGGRKSIYDLYDALDYVRLALNEGLDVANERYKIYWDTQDGRTIRYKRTRDAFSGDSDDLVAGGASDW